MCGLEPFSGLYLTNSPSPLFLIMSAHIPTWADTFMYLQSNQTLSITQRALELLCLLALIGVITDVFALETPNRSDSHTEPASLIKEATRFLNQEAAGLGEVHIQVNLPDQRADLPACDHLEAFLPPGARAQGKTTVGVRCGSPSRWTVFLQAQVQLLVPYLVAAHPLSVGQTLSPSDLVIKLGDSNEVGAGALTTPETLYGNVLTANIPAGQVIRRHQIKVAFAVQSGQPVRLKLAGQGFQITGEGIAVSNASDGQSVQVRTPRGSLVSGIARSGGTVEVKL